MLEVVCTAGSDGGLLQHFLLEVINSGPVAPQLLHPVVGVPHPPTANDLDDTADAAAGGVHKTVLFDMENNNELSTLNDQVSILKLLLLLWRSVKFALYEYIIVY